MNKNATALYLALFSFVASYEDRLLEDEIKAVISARTDFFGFDDLVTKISSPFLKDSKKKGSHE